MWGQRSAGRSVLAGVLLVINSVCGSAAPKGDWRIVPGERLGGVALGMRPVQVHHLLNLPTHTRRVAGLVEEQWISQRRHDDLTVIYRHGQVAQIEATSPAFTTDTGLSTRRTIAALARARRWQYASYGYYPRHSYRGWSKHYVVYADDVEGGLAWRAGVWTDLAADWGPGERADTLIVHRPDRPVVPRPDGRKGAADYLIEDFASAP